MNKKITDLLKGTHGVRLTALQIAKRLNYKFTEVLTALWTLRKQRAVKSYGCGTLNRRYWGI